MDDEHHTGKKGQRQHGHWRPARPALPASFKTWLQTRISSRESLEGSAAGSYLRRFFADHQLWHLNRRSAAGGIAVGFFFAFIPPVGQVPLAILFASLFRVNLPLAVAGTFINNPLTFPIIYPVAYRIGLALLGHRAPMEHFAWSMHWWADQLVPLAAGSALLGAAASGSGYLAVRLIWRRNILTRWRVRASQRRNHG